MAAAAGIASKFPRPQPTDIQAAALWGVAATTTALWLIQPFNWLKKTFLEKPVVEGK